MSSEITEAFFESFFDVNLWLSYQTYGGYDITINNNFTFIT